ncbi:glucosaminidase domain-containing protein [Enterococcus sp. BWB1-3]|uniref:glucosaminidase domain-containing protein n=1 Tax=Enterococcus sp. BWB1-3 TaxID=2787713 RepID=UPI001F02395F|nr:glucosaminidase domain-containing protein [Enterococcus sp. BWB1-3]
MNKKLNYFTALTICAGLLFLGVKNVPGRILAQEQNQTSESTEETERMESTDLNTAELSVLDIEETTDSRLEALEFSTDTTESTDVTDTTYESTASSSMEEPSRESQEEIATTTSSVTEDSSVTESSASQTTESNRKETSQTEAAEQMEEEAAESLPGSAVTEEVEANYEFSVVKNQSTGEFIDSISSFAQEIAWNNDLYASVMISQAILETGSGGSSLSQAPNYNLFGVKGAYDGKSVSFLTQEDAGDGSLFTITASFRKYPSYKESLEDYAKLLKNGIDGNKNFYSKTWKSNTESYRDVTAFLTGRYATDTQYGNKLNALIEAYDLTTFDGNVIEKKKSKPSEKAKQITDTELDSRAIEIVEKVKAAYKFGFSNSQETDPSQTTTYIFKNWTEEKMSVFKQPAREIMGSQVVSSTVDDTFSESSEVDEE